MFVHITDDKRRNLYINVEKIVKVLESDKSNHCYVYIEHGNDTQMIVVNQPFLDFCARIAN